MDPPMLLLKEKFISKLYQSAPHKHKLSVDRQSLSVLFGRKYFPVKVFALEQCGLCWATTTLFMEKAVNA